MPSLFVNSCILQYTTVTNDNGLTLTITEFSRSSEITKYTSRRLYIAVDAKNVISVMEKQTPTEAKILSSMNHNGKATAEQKREAKVYRANQLQNNREDAFTRFVNAFNTKKNNNQLTFTYTKKDIEQNVTLKLCLFGEVVQVVLKVPRNEITPTPGTREESKTIGIEKVNNGKNYVINEAAYAKYGHIERVVDFSDVEDEKQLLSLANIYVNNLQFDDISIEISAVDLHHLTGTIPSFELLDEIRCISRPHGLDRTFPLTEITIPLDDPSGVTYKLGRSGSTTMSQSTAANAVDLFKRINSMPSPNRILDTAKVEMSNILNNRTTGYVNIVQENDISQALVISNSADWRHATKLWKFDVNGLGYSDSTISNPGRYDNATTINADDRLYKIGMTMDGTIVADFIKTGLLEDGLGYNYWNLSTGEFRLSPNTLLDDPDSDVIATVSDLISSVESANELAESVESKEYNSSNILKKSDDFSILNKNTKWAGGGWQTQVSKTDETLCKVVVSNATDNVINSDIASVGVNRCIQFMHTKSYSSPSTIKSEIGQLAIKVASNTTYTLACYACGFGELIFEVSGNQSITRSVIIDHTEWKRYNFVFRVLNHGYNIYNRRSELNVSKQTLTNQLNNYNEEYQILVRNKASASSIKSAKKKCADVKKEISKINSELESLNISITRLVDSTISIRFKHQGLDTICVSGPTLVKGNVSKDWQPSDSDFFDVTKTISSKIDAEYLMDKLTQNGEEQGVYLKDRQLLLNAKYMMVGYITDKAKRSKWDLNKGTFVTNNMVANNIQANGLLQTMRGVANYSQRGVKIDLGSVTFINTWRSPEYGNTANNKTYTSGRIASYDLRLGSGRFDPLGLEIYGAELITLKTPILETYTVKYKKYTSGSRKGKLNLNQPILRSLVICPHRIINIKGLTYNKNKKITYATLAQLTFDNGLLTGSKVYYRPYGKLTDSYSINAKTGYEVQ